MAYGDQVALAIANAELQSHIERAAREAERNQLARELHDTVTQEIFSASMLAESIPRVWALNREAAEARLLQVRQLTHNALAALRTLLVELRPAILEQKSLADLLRQLGEVTTIRTGTPVGLTIDAACPSIPLAVKVAYYRIAQEALTNATKHANAQHFAVQLRYLPVKRVVQLVVQDDGHGFEASAIPAGHFGLGTMRERARSISASLSVTSRPGHGCRIAARWVSPEAIPDAGR
jgi:two-component system nitrate/nitrite sensor histidine kinase NarX